MIEAFHMVSLVSILLVVIFVHTSQALIENAVGRFPFLMPNVHPYRSELYLCTPIRVDYSNNYFIVGFEPNATMNTAHHMLLYGCGEPGTVNHVWNCGEMAARGEDDTHEVASPCAQGSHSQIIYAWARDAPKLELPEGVGFKVGKDSPIQYLVLQVHYMHKFQDGITDDSGIFLHYTKQLLNKQAGVLLLGTAGMIPPYSVEHMETTCTIDEPKVIHPFAFRVHTHSLGKVVSGFRIRDGKWTLLGKRDPMKPQMFYPVNTTEPIMFGDTLAARCTMHSNRKRLTFIGATNEDEMCNFYLMYYVENGDPLSRKYCFGSGPPKYYWRNDESLQNIPDEEASQLDD
ncbi:peptidylglycine alpha-hydroxylating monooxygenase [Sitodiplosis mosellana]|uniref:peptidylglycine alpha-hydroxylating monooxygenase n=1 Tax=Sitodiplosis mosellana TaxID=263140 RepID=UPI00244409C9|nr:peptidylglycine alpha-hydroxylating monooxygenase [Sitodiplosis mosellana]XP_055317708.1 peptidylglycine alpha-hydroxylating monooxygenase [Sitodiplosis mosellana]XP_055317709.1 peptidylglycine alpha-hydroxylating monooxygenase [Sitodiplosis mosellana]XP_055317710.1 peptidylglycine alpha-hydroxylating monooxygenase [Sitodiplosis mosellana]XP_055317711.1 peptidylglycine alpha-hydroxylating monooxygenase [Sitodiplosis mosellana]